MSTIKGVTKGFDKEKIRPRASEDLMKKVNAIKENPSPEEQVIFIFFTHFYKISSRKFPLQSQVLMKKKKGQNL